MGECFRLWEAIPAAWRQELDVCPILATGEDPCGCVLAAAVAVPVGGGLLLTVPFDPQPLRNLLAREGFVSEAKEVAGIWQVCFIRREEGTRMAGGSSGVLDLRELPPPEPMMRVLGAVAALAVGERLVVRLARDPLLLYPRLAERGMRVETVAGDHGEVWLTVTHLWA